MCYSARKAWTTTTLVFVGITPCRIADTRVAAGFTGAFGPPSLFANASRTFPIQSSTCSIPATALAYSLNVTVVPPGFLGFITVYPTGQPVPNASTLNNYLGTVVADACIVPGGTNGSIDVYSHDATDLIIDVNGYYVQGSGGSGGATVSVGTTTTGAAGTQASVTNSGSSTAAVFNFTIPQGPVGPQGAPGSGGSQWTTTGSNIYNNSGNVGIGTTTPGQKLEVNGNVMVDGNVNLSGAIYSGSGGVPVFQAPNDNSGNFAAGYGSLQAVTPTPNGGIFNCGGEQCAPR